MSSKKPSSAGSPFEPGTECITPPRSTHLPPQETPADDVPDATQCLRPGGALRAAPARPEVYGYELMDELGRGGMGVVYKAWQRSLQRTVALKMVIGGSFASEEELTRFRAEAMAVARLHHPHLLSIYEIGETNGLPFYSMEYLAGGSLARRLNGAPLKPRSAAILVRSLAQAMDYAHKNGIVHRDLKPANILLSEDAPTPLEQCMAKITDFGIAKYLHQDSSYTRTGDILGTPHYMAPEQAVGNSAQAGPSADVYSLGAILYELLTGRTPFHGLDGAAVLVKLTREDPEPPSHWVRSLPRDLETICLKCLEKDPAKRYASAGALADDLNSFLQGETIRARPASLADRAQKWVRRRPAQAAVIAMALTVIVFGFSMMAMMYHQAINHARKQDELLTETKVLLADAYLDRGIHLAERGDVRRGMHWIVRSLEMSQDLEQRTKKPSELASIIRMNLSSWGQCVAAHEISLPHTDWVWDLAFTPDQRYVATASKDQNVQVWDGETGLPVGPPLAHPQPVWGVAFGPDNKTMFTLCGEYSRSRYGDVRVWSMHPEKRGHFVQRGEPVKFDYSLARMTWNATYDRVCVMSRSGVAHLYAFDPTGPGNGLSLITTLDQGGHFFATFSPDGTTLATIGGMPSPEPPYFFPSGNVYLWDGRTGKQLGEPLTHTGAGRTIAYSKDGRFLIVGTSTVPTVDLGEVSFVHTWDVAERKRVFQSTPLSGRIKTSTVADNGTLFAVSIFEYTKQKNRLQINDGNVLLWQLHPDGTFERHGPTLRSAHVVWSMEFSPDSRMLLAGCENRYAFLWSVSTGQELRPAIVHEGNSVKVTFRKDGRMAVTASAGGGVSVSARLFEVPHFGHIGRPLPQPAVVRSVYWSNDNNHAWVAAGDSLGRWDPHTGVLVDRIHLPTMGNLWFHRTKDDNRIIVDRGDAQEKAFNLGAFDLKTKTFKELPFVSERQRGASSEYHAQSDMILQVWTKPSRFQLMSADGKFKSALIAAPKYELLGRCLSNDATLLAVSQSVMFRQNRVIIYNTKDMSARHTIEVAHPIMTLAFSPDGKTLALGGKDRQVQRLDVETGAWIGTPLLHESMVVYVGFIGNDRRIVTSSDRGQLLLWDAPTGKRIGPAFEHQSDLVSITMHPKGTHILTGTNGKMAMTWRIPEPVTGSIDRIRLWVETMTGMEMKEQDNIVPIPPERLLEKRRLLSELGGAPK